MSPFVSFLLSPNLGHVGLVLCYRVTYSHFSLVSKYVLTGKLRLKQESCEFKVSLPQITRAGKQTNQSPNIDNYFTVGGKCPVACSEGVLWS